MTAQLQDQQELQRENDTLRRDMDDLIRMTQEDIAAQQSQVEQITREIMLLGSRNGKLEAERYCAVCSLHVISVCDHVPFRDDLMQMLEERDYQTQMLRTGFGLHRQHQDSKEEADEYDEYDENLESLAQVKNKKSHAVKPVSSKAAATQKQNKEPAKPQHKEVADVTREYLVSFFFDYLTYIRSVLHMYNAVYSS